MRTRLTLVLLCASTIFSAAQSATEKIASAQETEAHGYWIDPSTNLMWTAKDNGQNIKWRKAIKYCRDLQLAGYADWKLPTIDQLEAIYDGSGFSAPAPRPGMVWGLAGKPKGGLLLTGVRHWSSNRVNDDRGRATGYSWQFDFSHGGRWKENAGYSGSLRALCVRDQINHP